MPATPPATRRLLFWLRVPYAADVALLAIGLGMLVAGNPVGWWVLVFAGIRALVGTIALVYVAPRIIASRVNAADGSDARPR